MKSSDEYRVVIRVTKAPEGKWWAKLYERRIIKGIRLSEMGEISWNKVVFDLISDIEDIIKSEKDQLKQKIKLDKE